jgi:hypothetical protein
MRTRKADPIAAYFDQKPGAVLQKGTTVKVDHGNSTFFTGVVRSFQPKPDPVYGMSSLYKIEITGGVNSFGEPAPVGETYDVHYSHVSAL